MNDHDVIDGLRTALDGVRHEHPLPEVARRARVLRARRRAPGVVAASLAVAGAITVGVSATAPSSAFADWTSQPEAAAPAVAAAIDSSCRGMWQGQDPGDLLLLDVRGQHAVALYRDQTGAVWECGRFQGRGGPGDAGWWDQGGGSGPNDVSAPTSGQPIVIPGSSATWGADAGAMTSVHGRVLPGAARVEVRVPGATVTAAVADGYFEAWWPSVSAEGGEATVTAYDAGGAVLATTATYVVGFGT